MDKLEEKVRSAVEQAISEKKHIIVLWGDDDMFESVGPCNSQKVAEMVGTCIENALENNGGDGFDNLILSGVTCAVATVAGRNTRYKKVLLDAIKSTEKKSKIRKDASD